MIKSHLWKVLCVIALGPLLVLCGCDRAHPVDATVVSTLEVAVVTLKTRPISLTQELPGRTSAFLMAEVRPQVSGIIKRRLFVEGGYVEAGQGLYELDDVLYRAQYESARAASRKAQATLVAAQLAARRSQELFDSKILSAQDNDNAVATEARARADLAAADANVALNGVSLTRAHIVAPISGRIGKSNVTQGALVTADQATVLATIQRIDPIYVEVNQSGSELLSLKEAIAAGRVRAHGTGASAKILLENGSIYSYEGKLQFADATVDPGTGNFLLRIVVPNPKQLLLPGMYVHAILDQGTVPVGLLVPQQAITRDPKGNATALVVGKDGKVEQHMVRLSRSIENQWLVEDGLSSGDQVIVEGSQKVAPGASVRAVEQMPTKPAPANPDSSQIPLPPSDLGPGH